MMAWHTDSEVNQAIIRLIDSLCAYERNTGIGSHFLLIPEDASDARKTIYAIDGKPVSHTPFELGLDLDLLKAKILEGS